MMGDPPAPGAGPPPAARSLLARLAGAREALVAVALSAAAAVAIGSVRAPAADLEQRVAETSDVYVLPPTDEVVRLSLGYRSALADLLWSHVLVSQGLHTMERRRFENLTLLLDAINALDPTFRDPCVRSWSAGSRTAPSTARSGSRSASSSASSRRPRT
ncbi:hypothetical protein WME79_23920 [Sorangium sp. So ce726]|uniref:hypothetical protein n=1 Tax=Sorangium sp. So ce726 TaxID=3133319 RepID=UPI003F619289